MAEQDSNFDSRLSDSSSASSASDVVRIAAINPPVERRQSQTDSSSSAKALSKIKSFFSRENSDQPTYRLTIEPKSNSKCDKDKDASLASFECHERELQEESFLYKGGRAEIDLNEDSVRYHADNSNSDLEQEDHNYYCDDSLVAGNLERSPAEVDSTIPKLEENHDDSEHEEEEDQDRAEVIISGNIDIGCSSGEHGLDTVQEEDSAAHDANEGEEAPESLFDRLNQSAAVPLPGQDKKKKSLRKKIINKAKEGSSAIKRSLKDTIAGKGKVKEEADQSAKGEGQRKCIDGEDRAQEGIVGLNSRDRFLASVATPDRFSPPLPRECDADTSSKRTQLSVGSSVNVRLVDDDEVVVEEVDISSVETSVASTRFDEHPPLHVPQVISKSLLRNKKREGEGEGGLV